MFITIDRNSRLTIKKQLYDGIVSMILNGEIRSNYKLPSTREMANQLGIARNTVIEIYEQLIAEGYCCSKKGMGTYITEYINNLHVHQKPIEDSLIIDKKNTCKNGVKSISLYAGTPDLEHFPVKDWLSYMKDYFYGQNKKLVGFTNRKGYEPLRTTLVTYLRMHKAIKCSEKNVYITNGTSGALNMIAMTMKEKRNMLITEAYGMDFVPYIFNCHGYKVESVSVDVKGMETKHLPDDLSQQLIYTTPSHQMPLGGVLPINRRQRLIEYARKNKHFIIEDDYDSEFRHVGAQVNALKQLDSESVIYIGTFSKTIGPGLRIGYMVVPDCLISTFDVIFEKSFSQVQAMDQYCLSRLIDDGRYEKVILKLARLYKKKNEYLMATIDRFFKGQVEVIGSESGMHLLLKFKKERFPKKDKQVFEKAGLEIDYLEDYAIEPVISDFTDTIIIGYGHLSIEEIDESIERLSSICAAL